MIVSILLAAQESTCEGDTIEDRFEFALEMGFDGLEVAGVGGGVFESRRAELAAAVRSGVRISSAVAIVDHFMGDLDPDHRRAAIDEQKTLLTVLGDLGDLGDLGELCFVAPHTFGVFSRALPPFTPPRAFEESRALLLEALVEVAEHAERVGVVLALEPLNRFEDFVVNTLADASWYVDEVASPGLAITADTWHMNIEEASIGNSIRAAGSRIKHVQLGDSNRKQPGAGHIDFDEVLDALVDIHFEGWLAMECGLTGPARDVLPAVSTLLRRS